MYGIDHLLHQPNLPVDTPSEVEQIREYEPTYLLPRPLYQFQSLIDNKANALVQPLSLWSSGL